MASSPTYHREWYTQNKERRLQQMAARKQANVERIRQIKASTPCADCGGYFDPVAMDFDHRDASMKFKGVAALVNYAWDRIEDEIAKCDLVCANCHRVRTNQRFLASKVKSRAGRLQSDHPASASLAEVSIPA